MIVENPHPTLSLARERRSSCKRLTTPSTSPLAEGERIEARGSTTTIRSENPHPTLTLEKGEANVALTT